MNNEDTKAEVDNAILICGQLTGLAMRLNEDALEKWIDSNPEHFRYVKLCRPAIAFKRELKKAINNDTWVKPTMQNDQ